MNGSFEEGYLQGGDKIRKNSEHEVIIHWGDSRENSVETCVICKNTIGVPQMHHLFYELNSRSASRHP